MVEPVTQEKQLLRLLDRVFASLRVSLHVYAISRLYVHPAQEARGCKFVGMFSTQFQRSPESYLYPYYLLVPDLQIVMKDNRCNEDDIHSSVLCSLYA
jgi:hypothetical protein